MEAWHKGWDCFLSALRNLKEDDLEKTVYYPQPGSYGDGSHKQAAMPLFISYRQIVLLAKMRASHWDTIIDSKS